MSQLTINPEIGKDIDWEVGATYDMRVAGTVTAKTPEGGYTLDVSSVEGEASMSDEEIVEESTPEMAEAEKPKTKKRKSAVLMLIGKE